MKYTESNVKEALHKLNRKGLPYKYDLNLYRGCHHGCKYCYGVKSHQYLGKQNFYKDILVKKNIAEVLDKQLSSPKWKRETINLGGVCDSYQPIEKDQKLMRDVLKVLIKHKNPIVLSTKSDLILRDLDLLDELSHSAKVNVAICMTSVDSLLSQKIEPGASLPRARFNALKTLGQTGVTTGLHVMPIIPILADSHHTLEALVSLAHQAEVDYMLPGILYLSGGIKNRFYDFLALEYPYTLNAYARLYERGSANKHYKSGIHTFIKEMKTKYNVR